MSDRDRETWERFAAAALGGAIARQGVETGPPARVAAWCKDWADDMLAATKQRWPEKTITAGCETVTPATAADETVTEPDPGEGYRWVEPRSPGCPGETLRHDDECKPDGGVRWVCTNAVGDECLTGHFYRRRIDSEPQPSSGACQLPAETTPRADEVRSEVRSTGGVSVEELRSVETMLGPVVRRTDAERLIAAARREAEEARAECERLRLTDDEREAMEAGAHALNQASATARPDDRYSVRGVPGSFRLLKQAAAIRWFLARHAKGGAS
jgi:hypothetical protein